MKKENAEKKICPIMAHCVNPNTMFEANYAIMEYQNCMTDYCMAWFKEVSEGEHGHCMLMK